MIKILLIEDEDSFAQVLEGELAQIRPNPHVVRVSNKVDACAKIREEFFDVIVGDLKIPEDGSGGLPHENHGEETFLECRKIAPGTPYLFLTGFANFDLAQKHLTDSPSLDVFGTKKIALAEIYKKTQIAECLTRIKTFSENVEELQNIEIRPLNEGEKLEESERRTLRLVARRLQAKVVNYRIIGEGLSKTRTISIEVIGGAAPSYLLLKCGPQQDVVGEKNRYNRFVVPTLTPGSYAPLVDSVDAGAKDTYAVVYRFLDAWPRTFFDLIKDDQECANRVLDSIETIQAPWYKTCTTQTTKLNDLRQRLAPDTDLTKLDIEKPDEFERVDVTFSQCVGHGDFHGLNILVNDQGKPAFIDFGNVGPGAAALDPLTLELSLIFHPKGVPLSAGWPTAEQAEKWSDLKAYLENCPYPTFLEHCRKWMWRRALAPREVYACLYSYALRQLKYSDTDHKIALALAKHAVDQIRRS